MASSVIKISDIDQVFFETFNKLGDDALAQFIKLTNRVSEEHRQATLKLIEEIAYFIEDSTNRYLKSQAGIAIRRLNASELREGIRATFGDDLTGLELTNDAGDLAVLFTPDASRAGKFRVTYFSKHGFTGDSPRSSYQELLNESIQNGYRNLGTGKLDEFSQLESFKSGNEFVAMVQAKHYEIIKQKLAS